jgi:hypothetical protein
MQEYDTVMQHNQLTEAQSSPLRNINRNITRGTNQLLIDRNLATYREDENTQTHKMRTVSVHYACT